MVWLKAPEDVSGADMDKLMERIRLLEDIPDVLDLSVGRNYRPGEHGYQYGVMMTFKDRDAQKRYIGHPLHREIRDEMRGMGVTVSALDYED